MTWDPVWEDIFLLREWGKYPPERVVRFAATNFYPRSPRSEVKLLDLGCGPGACAWYMAREGFTVCGIDGSASGISRAKDRLAHEGLAADLRVGDFRHLPWEDSSFDGAVDNVALYANSFADCLLTVAEVRRVLKPGGMFLSASFTPRTWGYGLGEQVEPGGFADIHEGPLAGKGFSLFMDRSRIEELFGCFDDVAIDTESITVNSGKHMVEWWVVTCRVAQTV